MVELLRTQRERRFRLELHDPQPIEHPGDVWALAAQVAIVGIFVLLLIAALYAGRGLLLPIVVAVVIGETLAPVVKGAAERGVPRLLTAALMIAAGLALVGLAVTLLPPIKELIARAPNSAPRSGISSMYSTGARRMAELQRLCCRPPTATWCRSTPVGPVSGPA
jgi:predicted PurR-regulated permease PerM